MTSGTTTWHMGPYGENTLFRPEFGAGNANLLMLSMLRERGTTIVNSVAKPSQNLVTDTNDRQS